ncbi:uncharacterized protein LOC117586671 isoform X2 [Drosophila guanche]|uniref:Condensin-2 complex subunit H2 C-terminal domain-containing protein n=1 Tax=Drosophila guanche TaxID=7266 RepID=A0A3B0KFG8_DROGU|nr:uncharacterized protein LOC117586671 isoform X2 [Drosophila guanche]SPP83801.1 Hypothetical predicted protein [Drosophila guanche]
MDGNPPEESDPASTARQREQVLMVAEQRPATNVAKCIVAYEEQPELSRLVTLLEEVSKNSDYSTDLRLSTDYYGNHLLRHCLRDKDVPRRVALGSGGSAIQSFGKIYADRVEYISQTTDNINESMSSAQRETSEQTTSGQESTAPKPEEPQKRRVKKLTQKTVDPFMVNLEPRAFKKMSEEKRFSTTGMAKCNRNRTIEYLYQDHTPPNLWRNAPIVDPHLTSELDEKKQYKLFTYHVEHRYNTLLPDIPFERLNLIKEYVTSNNVSQEILNDHMSTAEFLTEYIALENKMLASRYGATVRKRREDTALETTINRKVDAEEKDGSSPKIARIEDEAMEVDDSADNATTEESAIEASEPMEVNQSLNPREKLQTINSVDSGLGMTQEMPTLDSSQLEDATLNASRVEGPALCSTLLLPERLMNDSSVLDTPDAEINALHITADKTRGLSSDDEGVVLSDSEERRMQSLSPKVRVRDILPGVPNKDTVTVLVDEEMRALGGIKEEEPEEHQPDFEEVVKVPIEVCHPLELNIFGLSEARLRRRIIFKLPVEFDNFKKSRVPPKRDAKPNPPRAPRKVIDEETAVPENIREPVLDREARLSLEFDLDNNFLGFRRPTHDSGVDDIRLLDSRPSSAIIEPKTEIPADATQPDIAAQDNCDSDLEAPQLDTEAANESTTENDSGLEATTAASLHAKNQTNTDDSGLDAIQLDAAALLPPANDQTNTDDSGFDPTQLDSILDNLTISESSSPAHTLEDWMENTNSTQEGSDLGVENPFQIDKGGYSDSSELVRDWHIRIAPMLEVAHERQNFKFADLGTEIIEACQQGNGSATLADVMQGKDETTMGRHFFASLKLLNDGNIVLKDKDRDKSKPLDISQYKMELKSTERKQVHPEDDIGSRNVGKPKPVAADKKRQKRRSTDCPEAAEMHVKMGLQMLHFSQLYSKIKRLRNSHTLF